MRSSALHGAFGLLMTVMCSQATTSASRAGMNIDYGVDGYTVGEKALSAKQDRSSSPSIRTASYTVTNNRTDTVRCHAWGWNSDWSSIYVYIGLYDSSGNELVSDYKSQYPIHTVEVTVEQEVPAGSYECRSNIFIEAFHVYPSVWVNATE